MSWVDRIIDKLLGREWVPCPDCQGRGRNMSSRTSRNSTIAVVCKSCKGSGRVLAGEKSSD